MENPHTPFTRSAAHPVLIAASIAVILFCSLGIAAIMGWIPNSSGRDAAAVANGTDPRIATNGAHTAQAAPLSELPPSALVQQSRPLQLAQAPAAPVARAEATAAPRERNVTRVAERRAPVSSSKWCGNCGNVESVRKVTTRASGSGVGAAGGAVLGGLLGNQIGGGSGRDIATVAGAVGGAVIGNQVEGNMKATTRYEVRVRLDDGSVRTFTRDTAPPWRHGERVRIVNGGLRSID